MVVAFWEARHVAEAERERTSVSLRERLNTKRKSFGEIRMAFFVCFHQCFPFSVIRTQFFNDFLGTFITPNLFSVDEGREDSFQVHIVCPCLLYCIMRVIFLFAESLVELFPIESYHLHLLQFDTAIIHGLLGMPALQCHFHEEGGVTVLSDGKVFRNKSRVHAE